MSNSYRREPSKHNSPPYDNSKNMNENEVKYKNVEEIFFPPVCHIEAQGFLELRELF